VVHETLSFDDVVLIHERLAADFSTGNDPISPAGVRSRDLLASAVARQHTANGSILKYGSAQASAAALAYGLCCNHPFHNGNKRTALVAMLVHLDRNRLILRNDTTQSHVHELILKVAKREMAPPKKGGRVDPDEEVAELELWIRRKATREERWERHVSGRQLRQILRKFDLHLGDVHSNTIDVIRYVEERPRWGIGKTKVRAQRICCIGWHDEGSPIAQRDIRSVRRLANLTEDDGVDARAFYGDDGVVDSYVNYYRKILKKLARQ
jgi:prophage maintenance system killer protein